jgi:lipopolysaccharide transport protein LptA
MQRFLILLAALFFLLVIAQEQTDQPTPGQSEPQQSEPQQSDTQTGELTEEEKRIIRITFDGGTEEGDLRFGPLVYTHPDPEGIVGTVSTLTIYGQTAELRGPEGEEITLTDAEGRRTATFSGGLRVTRNRLTAAGPDLVYTEEDGLGKLTGGVVIVVAPEEEGDDPVDIRAESADFDVDTDVSTSRGNVELENGNQTATANEVIYEEERDLGKLTSEGAQVTMTRTDDEGETTTITADVIYVLTESKRIHALGNVTVVDGSITSTGDEVFFDDEQSRAEVIGIENEATAVDVDEGISLTGERIEQRTDTDAISLLTTPSEFNPDDFKLTDEL